MSDSPHLSTEELTEQLRAINRKFDAQSVERHKANSELQKTIVKFGTEALMASDQINHLEDIVRKAANSIAPFSEVKEDAKQIKRVLFGDEKLREKGLVQRFDEVDSIVKKALIEQRVFFTILGGIIAAVGFMKGSGILKWLGS